MTEEELSELLSGKIKEDKILDVIHREAPIFGNLSLYEYAQINTRYTVETLVGIMFEFYRANGM